MALIPMVLGTCRATPATTLALVGAYRMTTPSTVTMVQGEAPRVGAITIKLVVGTTQSTDSSSIPQVATKQQMTSHTTKDTETIVVRLWPILFIVLQRTFSVRSAAFMQLLSPSTTIPSSLIG